MNLAYAAHDLEAPPFYRPEGHRATYTEAVREAMTVLDRVAEGQDVPKYLIDRALRATGDKGCWRVQ